MRALKQYELYLILIGCSLFFCFETMAQIDTSKVLHVVEIKREKDSINLVSPMQAIKPSAVVTLKEIQRKKPIDLGELTRSFPGVFLKSYGGVGGLKTMNARGLGSQHFLVLINGFPYLQGQSGSANLGNIQADFIEAVKYSNGGTDEWNVPALSKSYGGILQVFTSDQMFVPNRSKIAFSTLIGSFGRYKAALNTYFSNKKFYVSANAYGFSFKGNYPFSYKNGYQTIQSTRLNNNIGEGAIRFGAGYQTKNHRFQIGGNNYKSAKQLPGAIIFYQPTQTQDLNSGRMNFNFTHRADYQKIKMRNQAGWTESKTNYIDPYYVGKVIDDVYRNRSFDLSHTSRLSIDQKQRYFLNWSAEYRYTELTGNTKNVLHPERHRAIANLGFLAKWKKWNFMIDLPLQNLLNKDRTMNHWKSTILFTPSAGFSTQFFAGKMRWNVRFNVAKTARVASFNELFYGKSGKVDLKPEKAQMGTLGFSTRYFSKQNFTIKIDANGYLGWINDKIVTIPTKNLFVWSVRNVGKVLSYGFDANLELKQTFLNNKISLSTIQKTALTVAKDYTDKTSAVYKQQIPYTPYWNYSGELILNVFGVELSWESSYSGFRFVLGENIYANLVNEYWLHNIRLSYKWQINAHHNIHLYAKINNITNKQYQVIRSFPMPGRSFEIGLKYAWNKKK